METIVKILIKEHNQAKRMLSEMKEIIQKLNMNPKEPNENFESLVKALSLLHLLSEFAELTIKHKNIEEYSVYPKFKDLGYAKEAKALEEQHETISKLINEIIAILNKYKSREKKIEQILVEVVNVCEKVREIYIEHMKFEEHLLSKILDNEIKVKETQYMVV